MLSEVGVLLGGCLCTCPKRQLIPSLESILSGDQFFYLERTNTRTQQPCHPRWSSCSRCVQQSGRQSEGGALFGSLAGDLYCKGRHKQGRTSRHWYLSWDKEKLRKLLLEMVSVLAMGIQSENKRTSGLLLCSDAQEGHSAMGSLLLRTVGRPSGWWVIKMQEKMAAVGLRPWEEEPQDREFPKPGETPAMPLALTAQVITFQFSFLILTF